MEALERVPDPRAVEPLLELLSDSDFVQPDMRWCALEALGKIGKERAIPVLIDVLKNPDADVAEHNGAFDGIIAIGEPATSAVVELMKSRDRRQSPYLLARIGGEAALEPLTELLNDPAPDVRITGIESLAQLAEDHPEALSSRCLTLIKRKLEDTEEKVRNNATYWVNEIRAALEA